MGTVRLLRWLCLLVAITASVAKKFDPIPIPDRAADVSEAVPSDSVPIHLTGTIKHVRARLAVPPRAS